LLPTKLATSLGSTGPIMPNVIMSIRTVMKMKIVAPLRGLLVRGIQQ
jgi:hypothetical protein